MKIVLAGDGWGAVALYNSFVKENKDFGIFTEDFNVSCYISSWNINDSNSIGKYCKSKT